MASNKPLKTDTTNETESTDLHRSRLVRGLYLAAGIIALVLAVLGIMLPVLPTTPFVLLAAACFARSSERFYNALLANRITGSIIYEWRTHRSMPRRVKKGVYVLMCLSFGSSILLLSTLWHQLLLAAVGIILTIFIWRIPVRS